MNERAKESMERTLAAIQFTEIPSCLRFIDVMESSGGMGALEAAEWRRQLHGLWGFALLLADTPPCDARIRATNVFPACNPDSSIR